MGALTGPESIPEAESRQSPHSEPLHPRGRVSVVIPHLNGWAYLRDCLNSLAQQGVKPLEVIVVDNGSTDDTFEQMAKCFPWVSLLRLGRNRGFPGAVNAGIRGARGDYIALLNNDTVVDPDWLSALVDVLDTHPDVGSCASRVLRAEEPSRIWSAGDNYRTDGLAENRGARQPDGPDFDRFADVFGAGGVASLFRRAALDCVGLLDEDLFAYYEDVDLAFRLQLAGYRCLYVPGARVLHVGSATARHLSHFAQYYGNRNEWLVVVKNWPLSLLLRRLPLLVLTQLKLLAYNSYYCHWPTAFRAKLAALALTPRFLWKRRSVQRLRRAPIEELDRMMTRPQSAASGQRSAIRRSRPHY